MSLSQILCVGGGEKKVDNQVDVLNTYFDCKKIIVPREKKSIIRSIICCLVCLEVSLRKCLTKYSKRTLYICV